MAASQICEEGAAVIRKRTEHHPRMTRQQPSLKTVLSEIAKPDDRSNLFWWLVEHHDEIVAAANGRRMRWRRLCVRFAELGLTDRTGKPATEKVARLTWFRARQEVARVRGLAVERPSRPGSVFPSRMPKDWKPEAFRLPAAEPTSRGHLTPGIHSGSTSLIREPASDNAGVVRKLSGKEKIARLKLELAGRRGA